MLKRLSLSAITLMLAAAWSSAFAAQTQVIWHGHATVEIMTPGSATPKIRTRTTSPSSRWSGSTTCC